MIIMWFFNESLFKTIIIEKFSNDRKNGEDEENLDGKKKNNGDLYI